MSAQRVCFVIMPFRPELNFFFYISSIILKKNTDYGYAGEIRVY